MKLIIAFSLICFALTLLASCGSNITVHDKTLCAIGPNHIGVACDNIYSSHQVLLDETEWNLINTGWLCMSPEAYGQTKIEFSQFCSAVKCNYKQLQMMNDAFSRIENLNSNWK